MQSGGSVISDFEEGFVTITIPYVLSEGEDVDAIAVWFIGESGLESIPATYSNGYVTFVTNHFSYYTVTRLTPKERCALYGHNWVERVYEVTCTENGYTYKLCLRCHAEETTDIVEAEGHKYVLEETPATCLEKGSKVSTCEKCGLSYTITIPEQGHQWQLVDEAIAFYKKAAKIIKNGKTILNKNVVKSYNKPEGGQLVIRELKKDEEADGVQEKRLVVYHRFEDSIKFEDFVKKCNIDFKNWKVIEKYGKADKDFSAVAYIMEKK